MDQSIEPLLDDEQVASTLKVSVETLAAWRHTGRVQLPYVRIGGRIVRYKKSDVLALIDAGHQSAAEGV
ncbi:helix-turn-helix transcriptional regulator [Variovorax saccharolyticus]|uniref:helix-turn-helix transcriptional regulator n=1 Tax=Variovorax saccharolyticus TaxID=3053516 RepID=UPI0025787F52|nr:helix-turn-helix domain-containing protein [Variovorax sp. J22R187]MDM0018379.1 helix-turn-helix domain-containing protein [Variovorax sp. J22R187]